MVESKSPAISLSFLLLRKQNPLWRSEQRHGWEDTGGDNSGCRCLGNQGGFLEKETEKALRCKEVMGCMVCLLATSTFLAGNPVGRRGQEEPPALASTRAGGSFHRRTLMLNEQKARPRGLPGQNNDCSWLGSEP